MVVWKWKQRLIFHVTVVRELVFALEWSNRKDRNIDVNEYSSSEMVSVLCRQVWSDAVHCIINTESKFSCRDVWICLLESAHHKLRWCFPDHQQSNFRYLHQRWVLFPKGFSQSLFYQVKKQGWNVKNNRTFELQHAPSVTLWNRTKNIFCKITNIGFIFNKLQRDVFILTSATSKILS